MLKPIFSSPNHFKFHSDPESEILSERKRDFSWGNQFVGGGGLLRGLGGLAPPGLHVKKGPATYDRYFYDYLYKRCFLTKGVLSGGPQNAFLFYRHGTLRS